MAVKITKKPSPAPKNLSLKRGTENGNASITAKWGNPADAFWDTDHAWSALDEEWVFSASKNMSKTVVQQRGDSHTMADRVWVRDKGKEHTTNTMWYNRAKYHPRTAGRYLRSVTAKIIAMNGKGKTPISATFKFEKPRAPSIPVPTFNAATGEVTFKVNTNAGTDKYERYDTMYAMFRIDSANRNNKYKTWQTVRKWASTTSTALTLAPYDLPEALSLLQDQRVRIRVKAYARGLMGNSKTVQRDFIYSWPAQGNITSITASSTAANGIVTVRFGYSKDKSGTSVKEYYPVDSVKLQRLYNTTIGTAAAAAAAGDEAWEDVEGAVDDGNAVGFSDTVTAAMPEVRKHTWYRIVTSHCGFNRPGTPVEAKCLYRSRDTSGAVKWVSLSPGADGTSISMRMGWATDSFTKLQVAWSDHADAWESNDPPETFTVDWEDATPASGYAHSASFTIRRLDAGTPYYIRARRFIDEDVERYGEWCSPTKAKYPLAPVEAPTDVTLVAPAAIERGSGVDCTWTLSGGTQTAWQIRQSTSRGKVLASGKGPQGTATIPASVVGSAESLSIVVGVTTGGDWAWSNAASISVQDAPTLSLSTASTLTAQPAAIAMVTDTPTATVLAYVTAARNLATDAPVGQTVQAAGDVVWGEALAPEWAPAYEPTEDEAPVEGKTYYVVDDGEYVAVDEPVAADMAEYYEQVGYAASVTLPEGLPFHEGATYTASASATDPASGLSSAEAAAMFDVAWEHQAVCPDRDATVLAADAEALSVAITPAAPTGADETDVCDVYRLHRDGADVIAQDVPFGRTVTDLYAPFCNIDGADLAYRLCTRTADGDVDWCDVGYELASDGLRVDFGGESLSLPWNVSTSDSWGKPFELVERFGGARVGTWGSGATRRGSVSTDVIKVEMMDEVRAISRLAAYDGPCFVRTSSGMAFEGNVTVESFGFGYDSPGVPVSLSIEAVDLTEEFMVAPTEWGDEEQGGE